MIGKMLHVLALILGVLAFLLSIECAPAKVGSCGEANQLIRIVIMVELLAIGFAVIFKEKGDAP